MVSVHFAIVITSSSKVRFARVNISLIDLPKFSRLIFYGPSVFQGDDQATDEIVINDYPTYTNTFVMRGMLSLYSIHHTCCTSK